MNPVDASPLAWANLGIFWQNHPGGGRLPAGSGWHLLFTAIGRLRKSGLVVRYRLARENVSGAKLIQIAAAESLTGSMTPFS